MNTTVTVRNKNISIELQVHVVRVIINEELHALLLHQANAATTELVTAIKTKYAELYKTAFKVSDDSMSVEIWGHVYADKFAASMKKIAIFGFFKRIIQKIMDRCEIIDIGEKGHDYNRFFWNMLSPFKSLIARLLPGKKL